MNALYRAIGTSKQNVHQHLSRDLKQQDEQGQLVRIIQQIRADHPGMGAKGLYQKLSLRTMGRDRFYDWYRQNGFTIRPSKNWRRTTDSSGVIRFDNLLDGIELRGANQVWVSDITYYELGTKFCYLTFVMDLYSRKIKGFHASQNLRTEETTIPALCMAMTGLKSNERPIFHSDGGGQYYSKLFLELTQGRVVNSMGKSAYENPHAERLNRTIKNNYLYYYKPTDFKQLERLLDRAVKMYNEGKPHQALNGLTPKQFEMNMFN